jgi:hypothetical protein
LGREPPQATRKDTHSGVSGLLLPIPDIHLNVGDESRLFPTNRSRQLRVNDGSSDKCHDQDGAVGAERRPENLGPAPLNKGLGRIRRDHPDIQRQVEDKLTKRLEPVTVVDRSTTWDAGTFV